MRPESDIPISRSVAFPDLEPAALAMRRKRQRSGMLSRSVEFSQEITDHIELIHDSVQDEETTPERREEPRSEVARLTVYVLNLIVMLISFPIGMAVLTFNILGGENIRTTAHAVALAGMVSAIGMTQLGQELLTRL